MMYVAILFLIPITWSLVFLIINFTLLADAQNTLLVYIEPGIARILWIAGCLHAARAFEPGDYLRKAWLYFCLAPIFYLSSDILLRLIAIDMPLDTAYIVDGVLVTAGNAASVTGIVMFSRAWKLAGIELPGPKWIQWIVIATAALLAIVIVGAGSLEVIPRLVGGELEWIASLASTIGDLICLTLIAPLFLTALALRGGLFMRPWVFLTASMFSWLLYDAAFMAPLLGLNQQTASIFAGFFRSMACLLAFSAGLAQRSIIGNYKK